MAGGAEGGVRLAAIRSGDLPALSACLHDYWRDLGVVPPPQWHQRYVARLAEEQGRTRHTFWGMAGDTRIGFTILRIDPDWVQPERLVGYVAEFAVFPEFRRQGWGARLFEAACAWLRARRCADVELDVLPTNVRAQAFWQAQGCRLAYHRLRLDARP